MKRVRVLLYALTTAQFRVQAFWRSVVVDERIQLIRGGDTLKIELRFDSIDALQIDGGPGAMLELCAEPLFPEGVVGWRLVPGFPAPLALPHIQIIRLRETRQKIRRGTGRKHRIAS